MIRLENSIFCLLYAQKECSRAFCYGLFQAHQFGGQGELRRRLKTTFNHFAPHSQMHHVSTVNSQVHFAQTNTSRNTNKDINVYLCLFNTNTAPASEAQVAKSCTKTKPPGRCITSEQLSASQRQTKTYKQRQSHSFAFTQHKHCTFIRSTSCYIKSCTKLYQDKTTYPVDASHLNNQKTKQNR